MFTVPQIKAAHSRVKSGADFPAYIQDLKKIGVIRYETFVSDGHTDYHGSNGYKTTSPASYEILTVNKTSNEQGFVTALKAHQAGKTDYMTFCRDTAKSGIERWVVCIEKMTCTYFDKEENEILVEEIPK